MDVYFIALETATEKCDTVDKVWLPVVSFVAELFRDFKSGCSETTT